MGRLLLKLAPPTPPAHYRAQRRTILPLDLKDPGDLRGLKNQLEFAVERRQHRAVELAEFLKDKLTRFQAEVKARGIKAHFNSLGELQGSGVEFDRILGEWAAVREVARDMFGSETFGDRGY